MNSRPSGGLAIVLGGAGLGVLAALVIVGLLFPGLWQSLEVLGYFGAFLISIAGGATIIIPIPMLPIVAALVAALKYPALVGLAAALGETVGALSIYATGRGGGRAFLENRQGKPGRLYGRLSRLMHHHGWSVLFLVSAVLSPVFYPVALTSGVLRYEVKRYVAVVFVGKIIKCSMVAYLGHFGIQWLLNSLVR